MEGDDPAAAAAAAKRSVAMLRDARSVLRRLDVLLATSVAIQDSSAAGISEAREAMERVVMQLSRQQAAQQRQAREAVRRSARTQ